MRTSAIPRSSSACDTLGSDSFRLDDSGNSDDLIAAHDERPRLALRAGNLCVDEHVLDLLAPPGQPVAGAPCAYLKAWELRLDPPLAPLNFAFEVDRRALDPHVVVLAHRGQATAEINALRALLRSQELVEARRSSLRESEQVPLRSWMQLTKSRQDLVPNQCAVCVCVRAVAAVRQTFGAAVGLGLFATPLEHRPDGAVLALS